MSFLLVVLGKLSVRLTASSHSIFITLTGVVLRSEEPRLTPTTSIRLQQTDPDLIRNTAILCIQPIYRSNKCFSFCANICIIVNIIPRYFILSFHLWSAVAQLVECRTRNRESPGSNPRCYRFEVWAFSFTSRSLSRLSCINEYLAIDSGGNVSE